MYVKQTWIDGDTVNSPLNAARLSVIENGLAKAGQYLGSFNGAFPAVSVQAGDIVLRADIGTNGSLWQYTGNVSQGSGGWIVEGQMIICTSTTRPGVDAYKGMQLYETDTGRITTFQGGSWWYLGKWINDITSTSYNLALTTTALTAMTGMSVTATIPTGVSLEVEMSIPHVGVTVNQAVYLRLADGSTVIDGAEFSTGGGASIFCGAKLTGIVEGDGASHTVVGQGWAAGAGNNVSFSSNGSSNAPVRFRHRFI